VTIASDQTFTAPKKLRDLAPELTRRRLLIEGYYACPIDENRVRRLLIDLPARLNLKAYGKPTIHSPSGIGEWKNQGFDAFIPLVDSGISVYLWTNLRFFSVLVYSCTSFYEDAAVRFIEEYLLADPIEYLSF